MELGDPIREGEIIPTEEPVPPVEAPVEEPAKEPVEVPAET
jgi:hypothetical protein